MTDEVVYVPSGDVVIPMYDTELIQDMKITHIINEKEEGASD